MCWGDECCLCELFEGQNRWGVLLCLHLTSMETTSPAGKNPGLKPSHTACQYLVCDNLSHGYPAAVIPCTADADVRYSVILRRMRL